MKNLIYLLLVVFLFSNNIVKAQVAIGKQSISSESVSLEFGSENRGLILPWVTNKDNVTEVVPGTLVFDSSDSKTKVKLANSWMILHLLTTGTVVTTLQDSETEQNTAKVSIGTPTDTKGILVLEDDDKAMILPKVESPQQNILEPEPGTIVFDTKKQLFAAYNGAYWEFWN